jgi:hypothetical protein
MAASAASLRFLGGAMHRSIAVSGNWFRFNLGRVADIDVLCLGNSFVGPNYVATNVLDSGHYNNVHNDADGNTLLPPQNGFGGTFTEAAVTYGDTRYPHHFLGGVGIGQTALPVAAAGVARLVVDAAAGSLKVVFSNGTARVLATP